MRSAPGFAAAVLLCAGCPFFGGGSSVPVDDCDAARSDGIEEIEIGRSTVCGDQAFRPIVSDRIEVSHGLQGGQMIGISLRLRGDHPAACVAPKTTLTRDGKTTDQDATARTYETAEAGVRTTRTIWLRDDGLAPGQSVAIEARVGDRVARRELTLIDDLGCVAPDMQ